MKFHYSTGLAGMVLVILITTWYAAKVVALSTGHFALLYIFMAMATVSGFVFLYVRTFAAHIFPELEGIVTVGMHAMYDNLLDRLEKHSRSSSHKPFVYPQYIDNSHRGIIEYIPHYQHQRKVYLKHYHFILEELAKPDCHYELVMEQVDELKALLD